MKMLIVFVVSVTKKNKMEAIYILKKQDIKYGNVWKIISYHKTYESALNKLAHLEGVHKIEKAELNI